MTIRRAVLLMAAVALAGSLQGCYVTRAVWKEDHPGGRHPVQMDATLSAMAVGGGRVPVVRAVLGVAETSGTAPGKDHPRVDPRALLLQMALTLKPSWDDADPRLILSCPQLSITSVDVRGTVDVSEWIPGTVGIPLTLTLSGTARIADVVQASLDHPDAAERWPVWSHKEIGNLWGWKWGAFIRSGASIPVPPHGRTDPGLIAWRDHLGIWNRDAGPLAARIAAARRLGDGAGLRDVQALCRSPRGSFHVMPLSLLITNVDCRLNSQGDLTWSSVSAGLATVSEVSDDPERAVMARGGFLVPLARRSASLQVYFPAPRYDVLPTIGRVAVTPVTLVVDGVSWVVAIVTAPIWFPIAVQSVMSSWH